MTRTAARRLGIAELLSVVLGLGACGEKEDRPEYPDGSAAAVKLALNWFPEAEHGGYYAALVHGYFEDRGVTVEVLGGGPDAPVIQRLATGQVEFGVTNADGIINARAAGAPVIALMAPYQTNPRCIMVHAQSDIASIAEIADVTLALSQRPAFSHFLRHRYDFEGVTIVPYHGGVARFLGDSRYAQQGYVFSEPVIARREGVDVRTLMVADTGFNPYASLLIASAQTVRERPKLVRAVTEASVAGWKHYLKDPVETNRHILSRNPELDLEILAAGSRMSRALVLDSTASGFGVGHMTLLRWRTLTLQMVEAGLIDSAAVEPRRAFTTRFLPGSGQ